MANHLSKRLVTFLNAFTLESVQGSFPAGDYTIETERELLPAIQDGFVRCLRTTMIVRSAKDKRASPRFIEINPLELDDALARDCEEADRAENEGMGSS